MKALVNASVLVNCSSLIDDFKEALQYTNNTPIVCASGYPCVGLFHFLDGSIVDPNDLFTSRSGMESVSIGILSLSYRSPDKSV